MTPHNSALTFINDSANYPNPMTLDAVFHILRTVFVVFRAPRCIAINTEGVGACVYIPRANSPAVGCAFAVLVPPHLRPRLAQYEAMGSDSVLSKDPEIAAYFKGIPRTVLAAIQVAHDTSGDQTALVMTNVCNLISAFNTSKP